MKLSSQSLRQEIKYKVFFMDLPKLYDWLYKYSFFQESYSPRMVNSLYFDTPEYSNFYEKVDGIKIRKKFRIRSYSHDKKDHPNLFLEMKGRKNQKNVQLKWLRLHYRCLIEIPRKMTSPKQQV